MRVPEVWLGSFYFVGREKPRPIPMPVFADLYSEHQMIPGADDPGATVIQQCGYDSGIITVRCPWLKATSMATLQGIHDTWDSGGLADIEFGIARFADLFSGGRQTGFTRTERVWTCAFRSWTPAPLSSTFLERYSLEFSLRIKSGPITATSEVLF